MVLNPLRARARTFAVLATLALAVTAAGQSQTFSQWWGDRYSPRGEVAADRSAAAAREVQTAADALGRLHHWNRTAIDASGLDHTPEGIGAPHAFGAQRGPGRASRAMAIVHIAMFEAVNAIDRRYQSYLGVAPDHGHASMETAIAQAAHDTLVALYPSQAAQLDRVLADDLSRLPNGQSKQAGIQLGRTVARAILDHSRDDGSDHDEPLLGTDYVPGHAPGEWRQDPISQLPIVLGAKWGSVRPFVTPSGPSFRVPPPPAMTSRAYSEAFDEVARFGGDGVVTRTKRTADQTLAGIFWAYDGTPSLCAPPRLYNQIATLIADQMGSDVVQQARLLALINVAMSDAAIAIWESKYFYKVWRPVTGVREADQGTGPTGLGDGNPATKGDATFSPLGAPASNLNGPNFTPPFPAYPSGHAGFGGALFQTLRRFYGTDNIAFTFVSDELNGVTLDNEGNPRPLLPRSFTSLSQAEQENGQSRIYLGIHWAFDKTAGIEQGHRVADYVFDHAFGPS